MTYLYGYVGQTLVCVSEGMRLIFSLLYSVFHETTQIGSRTWTKAEDKDTGIVTFTSAGYIYDDTIQPPTKDAISVGTVKAVVNGSLVQIEFEEKGKPAVILVSGVVGSKPLV